MMRTAVLKTPLGWAGVSVTEQGIAAVVLPRMRKADVQKELKSAECRVAKGAPCSGRRGSLVLKKAVKLLGKYFSGERVLFDLPLDIGYYTPFQRAVWKTAAAIPYGETRPYGWVAKRIGKPMASRAVGQAMGANPVPVIIP